MIIGAICLAKQIAILALDRAAYQQHQNKCFQNGTIANVGRQSTCPRNIRSCFSCWYIMSSISPTVSSVKPKGNICSIYTAHSNSHYQKKSTYNAIKGRESLKTLILEFSLRLFCVVSGILLDAKQVEGQIPKSFQPEKGTKFGDGT